MKGICFMVQFDIDSVVVDSTSVDDIRRCELAGNTQDLISEMDGVVIESLYRPGRETMHRVYVHYDSKWWVVINGRAHVDISYTSIHYISDLKVTIIDSRMLLIDKISVLTLEPTVLTPVLPDFDSI